MSLLFILMIASTPETSTTAVARAIDQLVEGRAELPSLSDVQSAAVEALELPSSEDAASWASRARWRGLVPRVAGAIGSDADLDVRGSWSSPDRLTTTRGRQLGVDLALRFELGELVFSDFELRANREAIARAAAMQLARDRATQIYFERVEIALEQRVAPTAALAFAAARLDGLLDSITGGLLTRHRKGRAK